LHANLFSYSFSYSCILLETLNTDPYGNGWLADVTVDDASAVTSSLLDAAGYKAVIGE